MAKRLSETAAGVLAQGGTVEIAESFEVWFLGRSSTMRIGASLAQLAHRTGYWYHQLRLNGKAQEYALSQPHGPGVRDWEVHAVMASPLPARVDAAISWIDRQDISGDPLVRMLSVPAYHITAFWLVGGKEDRIVPIERSEWLEQLKTEAIYGEREFIRMLAPERSARATPRRLTTFSAPPHIVV
ncbi:MAG: hypothetical protein P4M07_28675 [Xanthobacteraceae bacterium]|nr:hypothetical protein [Xanthobacteraceae bacterium]